MSQLIFETSFLFSEDTPAISTKVNTLADKKEITREFENMHLKLLADILSFHANLDVKNLPKAYFAFTKGTYSMKIYEGKPAPEDKIGGLSLNFNDIYLCTEMLNQHFCKEVALETKSDRVLLRIKNCRNSENITLSRTGNELLWQINAKFLPAKRRWVASGVKNEHEGALLGDMQPNSYLVLEKC